MATINDETLVAYLDGELSGDDRAAIEGLLKSDDDLRRRVSTLQATWNLLEELPEREPSLSLAQSTIEMVALSLNGESPTWRSWLRKNRWATLVLAGLLSLLCGVGSARLWTDYETRNLLSSLPAIVEYRPLRFIDSVEYLEELVKISPALIEAAGGKASAAPIGSGRIPTELHERKLWVANLPEIDRGRLESNQREYDAEPEQRKATLNTLAAKIHSDPQRTKIYQQTIRAYTAFLDNKLNFKQQASLQQEPDIAERITEISYRVNTELAFRYSPSGSDKAAIYEWLDEIKEKNIDQLAATYPQFADQDSIIVDELLYGDANESFVTDFDIGDLIDNRLSEKASRLLQAIKDPLSQRVHLAYWISEAVQMPVNGVNGAPIVELDLREIFDGLSEDERSKLEFLPEDDARQELREKGEANLPTVRS